MSYGRRVDVTAGAMVPTGLIVGFALGFTLGRGLALGLALGRGVAQLALSNVLCTMLLLADGDGHGAVVTCAEGSVGAIGALGA